MKSGGYHIKAKHTECFVPDLAKSKDPFVRDLLKLRALSSMAPQSPPAAGTSSSSSSSATSSKASIVAQPPTGIMGGKGGQAIAKGWGKGMGATQGGVVTPYGNWQQMGWYDGSW